MRYFGLDGLEARIREHCRLANVFAGLVEESENFELMAPVPFALVCFRAKGSDALNEQIMSEINASGEAFLSHTKLNGKFVIRLSVGSIRVEVRHIRKVWSILSEKAARASAG